MIKKQVLIIGSLCVFSTLLSNTNSNLTTICTFEKEAEEKETHEVKNLVGADNSLIAILITRKQKKVEKKLQTIETTKRVSALQTNKNSVTDTIRDIYRLYPVGFT